LKRAIASSGIEGVVIAPGPNSRYLTGVTSHMMERPFLLFVPRDGELQLVAPTIEAGPYRDCPVRIGIHDWRDSEGPSKAMSQALKALSIRGKWGVEGRVPFQYLELFLKYAPVKLENAEPILQGLREVKDSDEVRLMKKSAEILSASFEEAPSLIREGMTELELARKLEEAIYSNGATDTSDMLVQSGPRSANSHSLPSSRRIRKGDSIVLDLVSSLEGYHADITRTLCLGRCDDVEKVYNEVLDAQEAAIDAAAEGVPVGEVDRAARSRLTEAGLGDRFTHRTGHGLGLEVHEAPYIVEGGREKLRESSFFTIEPGVYIPGRLGVRIEDNLGIIAGKGAVITSPPKEYGWWR
jgi:Xaa-Pro dipeptidase